MEDMHSLCGWIRFTSSSLILQSIKAEKKAEGKEQLTSTADEKSSSKDLRLRGNKLEQDQSPEDIVLRQGESGDPTVTLDAESYRAKAGVTI